MSLRNNLKLATITTLVCASTYFGLSRGIKYYTEIVSKPIPIYSEKVCVEHTVERLYNGIYHETITKNNEIQKERYFISTVPPTTKR